MLPSASSAILAPPRTTERPPLARRHAPRSHRAPRVLKSDGQLRRMRQAGRIVRAALDAATAACVPGATTGEVDAAAAAVIARRGGVGVLRGYAGPSRAFPACTCVSVNEQVVHGVPGRRMLEDGDIVTVDCAAAVDGWCCDAAVAVEVGRVGSEQRRLVEAAELALATAILMIRPGRRWSEIASTMQAVAEDAGYGIVPGFVGHGIGRRLHEPPQVPSLITPEFLRHHDFVLRSGMTLAIEPILALGSLRTRTLADGWTVVTADGEPACHVEETVAVTPEGAMRLTSGRERSGA